MNAKATALGIVGILLISTNLFVVSPFVMDVVEEKLSEATIMTNETWEGDFPYDETYSYVASR